MSDKIKIFYDSLSDSIEILLPNGNVLWSGYDSVAKESYWYEDTPDCQDISCRDGTPRFEFIGEL